ncbi:MAG: sigma-70 family RNA polymerase sigma factor [Ruminococcaceae bacterium]|nr:sigma-70 family RNA polymerase sigma factor [Oscillospiraceae bacterium]
MEKNKLRELVEQAKMNNRGAMDQLTAEYRQQVIDSCLAMSRDRDEAAKIAQDSFRIAFERLGELDSAENFLPWVSLIARGRCGTGTGTGASTGTGLKKFEGLATTGQPGQSGQLSCPDAPGALSTDAPAHIPITLGGSKPKKGKIVAAVSALLALALIAGTAYVMLSRGKDRQTADQSGVSWSAAEVNGSELHQAYAEFFDRTYNAMKDKVLLTDVTDDGSDELLVVRTDDAGTKLNIYTIDADGRLMELYNVDEYGDLESMGSVGLCEYEGKQCIYEFVLPTWAGEDAQYTETIFYFDENGERVPLAYWDETIDRVPLDTGSGHFAEFSDVRREADWAKDAFGIGG